MNKEEITALASEYAEEKGKKMEREQGLPNCLLKEVMGMDVEELINFLQWLLRRYCLVEKEAVRKWTGVKLRLPELRERVLICERVGNQYKIFIGKRVPSPCPDGWEWNQSTKESVVAWMPLPQYQSEIAKEVEG